MTLELIDGFRNWPMMAAAIVAELLPSGMPVAIDRSTSSFNADVYATKTGRPMASASWTAIACDSYSLSSNTREALAISDAMLTRSVVGIGPMVTWSLMQGSGKRTGANYSKPCVRKGFEDARKGRKDLVVTLIALQPTNREDHRFVRGWTYVLDLWQVRSVWNKVKMIG